MIDDDGVDVVARHLRARVARGAYAEHHSDARGRCAGIARGVCARCAGGVCGVDAHGARGA